MSQETLFRVTLSWTRFDYTNGSIRTSLLLSSIFALKQPYSSKILITYAKHMSFGAKFERIILIVLIGTIL